jgi:enhancing lycopene biosynthesis protein 2
MYDGSDIHETVFTLLALEAAREKPILLAPDVVQDRTVDHLTGDEVEGERRGVLRESARLARGSVHPLSGQRPSDLEALIIPGGYGPVVNFSTGFARVGETRRLVPEVQAFLSHFLAARKPIGLVGLGEVPVRGLLGQEVEIPAPQSDPRQITVDRERAIVHTPGFVLFTRLEDVWLGIETMVAEVLRLMEERIRRDAPAGSERDPA